MKGGSFYITKSLGGKRVNFGRFSYLVQLDWTAPRPRLEERYGVGLKGGPVGGPRYYPGCQARTGGPQVVGRCEGILLWPRAGCRLEPCAHTAGRPRRQPVLAPRSPQRPPWARPCRQPSPLCGSHIVRARTVGGVGEGGDSATPVAVAGSAAPTGDLPLMPLAARDARAWAERSNPLHQPIDARAACQWYCVC